MSTRDNGLGVNTYTSVAREPAPAAFLVDEERVLDADEIAAELVSDPWHRPARVPLPPAPRIAATVHRHYARHLQPSAADSNDSHLLRAELERLRTQMRARDAYLSELERALDANTRQLEAAGISSADDVYRLLGRVRGQAFRIAELESELRATKVVPATPPKKRTKATSSRAR